MTKFVLLIYNTAKGYEQNKIVEFLNRWHRYCCVKARKITYGREMKVKRRRKRIKAIFKATLRSLFFCFKILVLMPMLVAAVEEGVAENHRLKNKLDNEKISQTQSAGVVITVSMSVFGESK